MRLPLIIYRNYANVLAKKWKIEYYFFCCAKVAAAFLETFCRCERSADETIERPEVYGAEKGMKRGKTVGDKNESSGMFRVKTLVNSPFAVLEEKGFPAAKSKSVSGAGWGLGRERVRHWGCIN